MLLADALRRSLLCSQTTLREAFFIITKRFFFFGKGHKEGFI